jgi:phosphate transport system substrate-binding protein
VQFTVRPLARCAAALALVALVGCGSGYDDSAFDLDVPTVDPTASGSVVVSGSSTVEPISALVAEELMLQTDRVEVSVDGPGTGDGLQLFCAGQADVANASRPIKDEEIEACEASGIEFIELLVGIDGLSVVTPESNPLECLSFHDLYALVGPESEGFDSWADAAELAAELGSDTELRGRNLVVTAPGAESGTFDSFVELVIEPVGELRVEAGKLAEEEVASARDDYSAQPDDNAIIEAVGADPGGIGWIGYAYAAQAEGVHLVPIATAPGEPCVAPTAESIQDGSYPISRELYVYVNAEAAASNTGLAAMIDFYLGGLEVFVETSGYIALADPSQTVAAWEQRRTGSHVGS